jgi:hypothetical protein
MDITGNTGLVSGVSAFYLSNIGNANNNHQHVISDQSVSIPNQSNIYATDSTNGIKTSRQLTVYGVHRIYSNGSDGMYAGERIEGSAGMWEHQYIGNESSTGSTTQDNTHIGMLWNYYTKQEYAFCVKFGPMKQYGDMGARVLIPRIAGLTFNVNVYGMSVIGGMYMIDVILRNNGIININGADYDEYILYSKSSAGAGANSYIVVTTCNPNE